MTLITRQPLPAESQTSKSAVPTIATMSSKRYSFARRPSSLKIIWYRLPRCLITVLHVINACDRGAYQVYDCARGFFVHAYADGYALSLDNRGYVHGARLYDSACVHAQLLRGYVYVCVFPQQRNMHLQPL